MRGAPGRVMQSPCDESFRQYGPDQETGYRDSRPAQAETKETADDRCDYRVVVAWWSRLHALPVEHRMLLVEERVVHALPLLAQTHTPGRWTERMENDRILGGDEPITSSHEGQPEIAVLSPGHGETFVEPADRLECGSQIDAVRRNELRGRQTRRVALVVGWILWQWHDDATGDPGCSVANGPSAGRQPFRFG